VEFVRPRSLAGGERRAKVPRACPYCGRLVSLATPHVQVARSGVRLFCSADCMEAALQGWPRAHAGDLPPPTERRAEPRAARVVERKPRLSRGKLILIFLGASSLSPCHHVGDITSNGTRQASAIALTSSSSSTSAQHGPRTWGPSAPDEEELALEFMGEIGGDRWLHPLAGPARRMPIRGSRVFGAARNGDRPGECRSGHCGVDIGGEMWGEPVMAVHDGIVDRVKRVDEGNGGMYVRLAHREGRVFSQYFHLAAIPRDLREGKKVKAGQVIGLLGDTGVKESTAHLHFAISVKATPTSREIYMDPEPLIALWPLKVPLASGGADASWTPGVPLGAVGRVRLDASGVPLPRRADMKRAAARAKRGGGGASAAPEDEGAADEVEGEDVASSSPIGPITGMGTPVKSEARARSDRKAAEPAADQPQQPARFPFAAQPATTPP